MKKEDLYKLDAVEVYKMVLRKDLKQFPKGFWMQPEAPRNAVNCIKYLIENILQWNEDNIKNELNQRIFKNNKLAGMLNLIYKDSPYNAINSLYPNKFKPWEFKNVPMNFWTEETAKNAVKWLIEEKLQWSDNDIKEKLDYRVFQNNNLSGMLLTIYNNSVYNAINVLYPNIFKPWELIQVYRNYWSKDITKEIMKWLIEEKLQWSDEDIKQKLNTKIFRDNGLTGLLKIYNNSPYEVINSLYPNKFKPWEFKRSPMNFWNEKTGKEAVKWLIEEKLQWIDNDIKEKLNAKIFKNNRLNGLLSKIYKDSPYNAINSLYPNKFKKEDFKTYNYYKL